MSTDYTWNVTVYSYEAAVAINRIRPKLFLNLIHA